MLGVKMTLIAQVALHKAMRGRIKTQFTLRFLVSARVSSRRLIAHREMVFLILITITAAPSGTNGLGQAHRSGEIKAVQPHF
jgi:hypothetical protein